MTNQDKMIFDEGVLNVICSFINDPKTFRSFSEVSKRAWKVLVFCD